jgi:hypothetical protein
MFAPTMSGRGSAQSIPDQRAASNEEIVRRLFREMHNRGDERVAHEVIASPRLVQRLKTCLLRLRSSSPRVPLHRRRDHQPGRQGDHPAGRPTCCWPVARFRPVVCRSFACSTVALSACGRTGMSCAQYWRRNPLHVRPIVLGLPVTSGSMCQGDWEGRE